MACANLTPSAPRRGPRSSHIGAISPIQCITITGAAEAAGNCAGGLDKKLTLPKGITTLRTYTAYPRAP